MTFLEYLCERLLGPRAKPGGSYGDSYWCCPFHGGTKLPHDAEQGRVQGPLAVLRLRHEGPTMPT